MGANEDGRRILLISVGVCLGVGLAGALVAAIHWPVQAAGLTGVLLVLGALFRGPLALLCRTVRNLVGEITRPIEERATDERLMRIQTAWTRVLSASLPLEVMVAELLTRASNPMSPEQVADHLGMSPGEVAAITQRLRQQFYFEMRRGRQVG